VEETATGPKRSKPFEIFEANVLRLTALATTPHSPISATVDRLRQQTEGATALAQELGKTINSGRESGYDSADFQKHAAPLMADIAVLNETVTDFVGLRTSAMKIRPALSIMPVSLAFRGVDLHFAVDHSPSAKSHGVASGNFLMLWVISLLPR
jgi:hypothetical protein